MPPHGGRVKIVSGRGGLNRLDKLSESVKVDPTSHTKEDNVSYVGVKSAIELAQRNDIRIDDEHFH